MLILTGSNLGERHRELNTKVKEAVMTKLDFDQAKDAPENSDVDKLFKIDLASKYKNIEYIIEVLKAGDSLHISRALKCLWMYEDEYANIISVDNLHNNVIPFLSTKMKKKLLSTISTYVRNEDRAAAFYKYCMDNKLKSIALKFLNFTSIDFKLELLQDAANNYHLISAINKQLKDFIGLSFTLAEAYIVQLCETNRLSIFRDLSYLFTVSEEIYLDMLEKYVDIGHYYHTYTHLGLRISRSIMKKHKNRVLRKPHLFVKILHENVLIRHSTSEDAKIYLPAILPIDVARFWRNKYCDTYKDIINLLNLDEKFEYVKKIFITKYPNEEFEMSLDFYQTKAYKIMSDKEKETWALRQIARDDEILGIGKDYIWYKFVSFEKAFVEMKKLIMITPDKAKRLDMVNVLIKSAKNQRHVETLLKHYYARHINESSHAKENFLGKIIKSFNVYEFDEDCWTALNALFYSVDVYSMTNNSKNEYKLIALIYSIINEKEVHEAILLHIKTSMRFYEFKLNIHKLPKEHQEMVFEYLFECYMEELKKHENVPYDNNVRDHVRPYIYYILNLLDQYNKTKEDCPELLNKFMKLEWYEFEFHSFHCEKHVPSEPKDLLNYLKKDTNLLLSYLPTLKENIKTRCFYITPALKKLRIYFSNDIAKEFLKFFAELLAQDPLEDKVANAVAHGIFQLADDNYKTDFMTKYTPTEPKINHSELNEKLLRIQEAICAHACYSRPPVPLKYVMDYIKGDYLQYCLPMLYSYSANLPLPRCMEFVEALLDKPVSIQKHGIRLAFECFSAENLNKVVTQVWKKTKNVSLRLVIFKAIYNKVSEENGKEGALYFETLKTFTLTLNSDDDDELFSCLVSRQLPLHWMSEYIKIAWTVVNQLPLKAATLHRIHDVIERIDDVSNSICQSMVKDIVDQFIASAFEFENEGDKDILKEEKGALKQAKWKLTAKYVTYVPSKDLLDSKLGLLTFILNKLLDKITSDDKYVWKGLLFKFLQHLEDKSYCHSFISYTNVNILMESGLQKLQDKMSIEEIYSLVWQFRLGVIARQVIADAKVNEDKTRSFSMNEIALKFAKGLGNLIKEFVEKDMYFASFSEDIQNKVVNKVYYIKKEFDVTYKVDEMHIAVSFGLIQFDFTEIYLLVLNLIPSDPEFHTNEYFKSIMQKLTKLKNTEIQCNLYNKFGNYEFL